MSHDSWKSISDILAKLHPERLNGLTTRAVKDRAEKFVKEERTKENKKARQSGTDEKYSRKEAATVEAISLYEET